MAANCPQPTTIDFFDILNDCFLKKLTHRTNPNPSSHVYLSSVSCPVLYFKEVFNYDDMTTKPTVSANEAVTRRVVVKSARQLARLEWFGLNSEEMGSFQFLTYNQATETFNVLAPPFVFVHTTRQPSHKFPHWKQVLSMSFSTVWFNSTNAFHYNSEYDTNPSIRKLMDIPDERGSKYTSLYVFAMKLRFEIETMKAILIFTKRESREMNSLMTCSSITLTCSSIAGQIR